MELHAAVGRAAADPGLIYGRLFRHAAAHPTQVAYAEAVETYYPYTAILKPQQQVRSALLEFLRGAIQGVRTGYVFVNNRLEGSSPLTIEHILRELLGDPEGVKGS